jgi:hypothetical protein
MKKLYGYAIRQGESPEELMWTVFDAMTGHPRWQPIGGIAVSGTRFYQAMVLTEPYPEELVEAPSQED